MQTRSSGSDVTATSAVISFVVLGDQPPLPGAAPNAAAPVEVSKTAADGALSAGGGGIGAAAAAGAAIAQQRRRPAELASAAARPHGDSLRRWPVCSACGSTSRVERLDACRARRRSWQRSRSGCRPPSRRRTGEPLCGDARGVRGRAAPPPRRCRARSPSRRRRPRRRRRPERRPARAGRPVVLGSGLPSRADVSRAIGASRQVPSPRAAATGPAGDTAREVR